MRLAFAVTLQTSTGLQLVYSSLIVKALIHNLIVKYLTHWLPELFAENAFLDILEIFSLEMSQIGSDLLKTAWQHAFISTSTTFYNIFARACPEIKIEREFLDEKLTYM